VYLQKGVPRLSNFKVCKIAHMPISGGHRRLICFGYENSLITKRPESDQAGFKKDFRATAQAARCSEQAY